MNTCSILVVEDNLLESLSLCKALRLGVPDALVVTARTLTEARLLLRNHPFSFFILETHLPDGSGIDFIMDVVSHNPNAGIAVMTSCPLPEFKIKAEAFGVVNYLIKPLEIPHLLKLVQHSREAVHPRRDGETTLFRASLTSLTVLDIIQLKCLNGSTQTLQFKSGRHGVGRVYFEKGDIVHADTSRNSGLPALTEIISWKSGNAEELPEGPVPARTIPGSWQQVLLTAAHDTDDRKNA